MRRNTTVGTVDAEVLAYTAGQDRILDLALVEADCMGTAAHVRMLAAMPVEPPVLKAAEVEAVTAELARIVEDSRAGKFKITLEDQDVHLAVERRLTAKLGDLGKRVHTCRSRNDQVAVDLRLFGKVRLLDAMQAAAALAGVLSAFARQHRKIPMVGRTHMQPAMPSSVGLWASAWAESLLDDFSLLMAAYDLNDQCPLGSAASYGVPLPIDRQLTSDLLGFARPVSNVLHANQSRGKIESVILSALSQAMLTLSRLAEDLILFSMPEFGYFRLPAEYTTGSSIMPQKRNPDVMELLRAKAAKVMAQASVTAEIVRAAPSGYNRDLQETKEPFMRGFDLAISSLRVMTAVMSALQVDAAACRRAFTPDVFATDRALELVVGGMPFRDAYREVKAHLGDLKDRDPDAAIAAKTHLGAPAGLDFDGLDARIEEAARWADDERADFEMHRDALLSGAALPEPAGCGG
ncbi:MAG: argininosuccinate lyase [Kiritimatiellae bacterium]|nr:argininosuccinate lyase [Kiritimatiellia bacterium]MBR4253398.1 argininosuccinate lyase [Kiritimatiellia bacterium]